MTLGQGHKPVYFSPPFVMQNAPVIRTKDNPCLSSSYIPKGLQPDTPTVDKSLVIDPIVILRMWSVLVGGQEELLTLHHRNMQDIA